MGVSDQRHPLAAFYAREKEPPYSLDRRLGGPQNWSGHRRGKIPCPLPGIEHRSPGCLVCSQGFADSNLANVMNS
jgi:hypothetical protein